MNTHEVSPREQHGDCAPLSPYSKIHFFDDTPPNGEHLGQNQCMPDLPDYSTSSGVLVPTSYTEIAPSFGNAESRLRIAVMMPSSVAGKPAQGCMGGPFDRAHPAAHETPLFGQENMVQRTNVDCSEPTPGSNQSKKVSLHPLDAGGRAAAPPIQLNDQKSFNLNDNYERAKSVFATERTSGRPRYWTKERKAWLKAIVADQQSVLGHVHRPQWDELTGKFTPHTKSSSVMRAIYAKVMDIDMDRESWNQDEIIALFMLMVKQADWAKITAGVAKQTGRPIRPLHCVKMFGLHRHGFRLTKDGMRILTRREDRDLSFQEYTRLLEWKKEWEEWPDIHDNISLFIERFASTYRIACSRVVRALELRKVDHKRGEGDDETGQSNQ